MKKVIAFLLMIYLMLLVVPAMAEVVLDETFTKVVQGVGAMDAKTFPLAIADAGEYSCYGFVLSERGISSIASNTVLKVFIGTGPFDITFNFTWPSTYAVTEAPILSGEVRTGKIMCERPEVVPPPTADPQPNPFFPFEVQ